MRQTERDRGRCERSGNEHTLPQRGRGNATTPQGASGRGTKHRTTPEGQTGNPGGPPPKRPDPWQPVVEPAGNHGMQPPCHNAADPESAGVGWLKTAFSRSFRFSAPRSPWGRMAWGAFVPHVLLARSAARAGSRGGQPGQIARTRRGLPDPSRILSGAATNIAPDGGRRSRLQRHWSP